MCSPGPRVAVARDVSDPRCEADLPQGRDGAFPVPVGGGDVDDAPARVGGTRGCHVGGERALQDVPVGAGFRRRSLEGCRREVVHGLAVEADLRPRVLAPEVLRGDGRRRPLPSPQCGRRAGHPVPTPGIDPVATRVRRRIARRTVPAWSMRRRSERRAEQRVPPRRTACPRRCRQSSGLVWLTAASYASERPSWSRVGDAGLLPIIRSNASVSPSWSVSRLLSGCMPRSMAS